LPRGWLAEYKVVGAEALVSIPKIPHLRRSGDAAMRSCNRQVTGKVIFSH
jgi:hypothetical protein